MAEAQPLLTITGLSKSLQGRSILNVDRLEIGKGQCVLLRGANGAGKTTLLKIIAGLLKPDAGQLCLDGVTGTWRVVAPLLRKHIVYLHQRPYLFDCSVAANVGYGLRRRGVPGHQITARVTQSLDRAGLSHLAERNANQLSGGETQRVALARARVLSPRVLLLDEPMAGMDRDARRRTDELLRSLRSEDTGLIVTSHELDSNAHWWDAEFELENGQLHALAQDD